MGEIADKMINKITEFRKLSMKSTEKSGWSDFEELFNLYTGATLDYYFEDLTEFDIKFLRITGFRIWRTYKYVWNTSIKEAYRNLIEIMKYEAYKWSSK